MELIMTIPKVTLAYIFLLTLVEAKWHTRKRDIEIPPGLCDPRYTNKTKIQCYCLQEKKEPSVVKSAECYLGTDNIGPEDEIWNEFIVMENVNRLVFTNSRGIVLKYIPTKALKIVNKLQRIDIKYSDIKTIRSYAFANMSSVSEIALMDNQIETLEANAFANHEELKTINLDKNNVIEINRDVFINLPSLERLYLTSNKITTIHDKAFVHLHNLIELEIDRNKLFSLNAETFAGLHKLKTLDLSSNSLEVIGDNTFMPLTNLKSLNLERNQIQMIDEKGFNGLNQLRSLSLAHNKITDLEGKRIFEGLYSLNSLSLRANKLKELKLEIMRPILNNFYAAASNLDVEDNDFPCKCTLDWFMELMNKTQNGQLKLVIDNLKCNPTPDLRASWVQESEKTSSQSSEDDASSPGDYEYYDDTQLDGKLFYSDVRHLINCTSKEKIPKTKTVPKYTTISPRKISTATIKNILNPSIAPSSTIKTVLADDNVKRKIAQPIENQGLLDLSESESNEVENPVLRPGRKVMENREEKKKNTVTTTRLATVSEKPTEGSFGYEAMASDEGKPDKIKADRSLLVDDQEIQKYNSKENASPKMLSSFRIFISLATVLVFIS